VTRKVCVVTGSRAEYGLLRWVLEEIRAAPELRLQLAVTGMHLSPEFGLTYREIERDGFQIDRRVEMLLSSDSPFGIAKSMGLGLIGFADALRELEPDLLLVLGDRFEIFSAAAAALVAGIPIAHVHGGELTEGAFDEALRHSITKMAQLHFVAAEEYRQRVVQLGEHPDRVFLVGGLGLDNVSRLPLLDRPALETALDFRLGPKNLLVTFHPVTLEAAASERQLAELLAALDQRPETHLIFTLPNADTQGRALCGMVERYAAGRSNARAYVSLGQTRYLSCLRQVDAIVGNSSSGLIEAPAFHIGTVNIGDRQRGRLKAASVIDCKPDRGSINAALDRVYSQDFKTTLANVRNPYGEGGASAKIVAVLRSFPLDGIVKKSFYDLPPKPPSQRPLTAESPRQ
jgi:GDP/UDP-N,N'-diacetylbacillosamine 2-epimerase (hydrolysing)